MFAMIPEDVTTLELHQQINKLRLELRSAQIWLDRATITQIDLEQCVLDTESNTKKNLT
ncbi:MAG TPA: hypothetical protein VNW29_04320 [Candidatus Sulfotelmatobacter sp.]|jgi:hypothetical protein|nr:hypothetical protein [Candidatus Sulfotelmatobacter sp.]